MFARDARVSRGRDNLLFLPARKVTKEPFRGSAPKNPVLIGKNPMIFTELNRKKELADKNPQIFVGEEQVSRKSENFPNREIEA